MIVHACVLLTSTSVIHLSKMNVFIETNERRIFSLISIYIVVESKISVIKLYVFTITLSLFVHPSLTPIAIQFVPRLKSNRGTFSDNTFIIGISVPIWKSYVLIVSHDVLVRLVVIIKPTLKLNRKACIDSSIREVFKHANFLFGFDAAFNERIV